MQVVINIPNKVYEMVMNTGTYGCYRFNSTKAIRKGIPLPKGHGKLKDADKIANEINALKDNWNRYGNEYESGRYESYDYAVDTIDDAQTIIEADKAESEDKE